METTRPPSLSPLLLCALLAWPAAPLWAVPVYQQSPAPKAQLQLDAQRQRCLATVRAQLRTRDGEEMDIGRVREQDSAGPDWLGGDPSAWSAHLAATLQGGEQDPIAALASACKLADSAIGSAVYRNGGVDSARLLQELDAWLELSRGPSLEEEESRHRAQDARERLQLAADEQHPLGQQPGITSSVPEPASYLLLLAGLAALALRRARRAR